LFFSYVRPFPLTALPLHETYMFSLVFTFGVLLLLHGKYVNTGNEEKGPVKFGQKTHFMQMYLPHPYHT
jgi:hypothetical protein